MIAEMIPTAQSYYTPRWFVNYARPQFPSSGSTACHASDCYTLIARNPLARAAKRYARVNN